MLEKLNWLFIIWTLTRKFTDTYKDKDNKDREAYRCRFDYMGWTYQVNVDDVLYNKLEEWMLYILEVKAFTNEKLKFCTFNTNKTLKVYEINGDWFTDLF